MLSDGMKFLVNAIKMNATLEVLNIYDNRIESEDATSLVRAVKKHRKVFALFLDKCDRPGR